MMAQLTQQSGARRQQQEAEDQQQQQQQVPRTPQRSQLQTPTRFRTPDSKLAQRGRAIVRARHLHC